MEIGRGSSLHRVVRDFTRPRKALIQRFLRMDAATVYEAMGKVGLMDREIRPVGERMKMVGPALTVHLPEGDNLMEHRALALAKRGDVLVIATEGPTGGTWGQVFATMAIRIGLAGVVSDGFVRD